MALHEVLIMYEEAIIGSFTSWRVVKIRAAEPQRVKSHVMNDNWPVCPCLKLVMI